MESNFKKTVESLFSGMENFVSSKTVVGEAIHIGDTIILPLVDVTFGVGAGASEEGEKQKGVGGGALGAKISPSAVLVIQDGKTKLVDAKNSGGGISSIIDMVPNLMDQFASLQKNKKQKKEENTDINSEVEE